MPMQAQQAMFDSYKTRGETRAEMQPISVVAGVPRRIDGKLP